MATRRRDGQPTQMEELLGVLRAHLPGLRERWAVRNLWAFGSFVRGEADRRSDLDLSVEFDQAPTLFEFVRLERHIRELLGVKVDLVMRTALKPAIGARILEEAVPV